MSGPISGSPAGGNPSDPAVTRVTPDIPDAANWEIDREPSLGRPVRTVITDEKGNPLKAVWKFKVALGGKERDVWVDGKNKRKTGELVLTFNITRGDMKKPDLERETALATISELRGKFARLDKTEARDLYKDLKNSTQKIDIVRIKEDKKGPVLGICILWKDEHNNLFALYHDQHTGRVFKKEFPPGSSTSVVQQAIKEMYLTSYTGSDAERSWTEWLKGAQGPKGSIIYHFDQMANKGKHERFEPDESLKYGTPEQQLEYEAQVKDYEAVKGYKRHTRQDRLSRMPVDEPEVKKPEASKESTPSATGAAPRRDIAVAAHDAAGTDGVASQNLLKGTWASLPPPPTEGL